MKTRLANVRLSFKELMILDHALNSYLNRANACEKDVREENALLDRVNNNIRCLKGKRYGEKVQRG